MDIQVGIIAKGDTSKREVAELAEELRDAISGVRGVENVKPIASDAPDGAKGIGQVLGALLMHLPAGLIPGVLEVIKAVISRPAQPRVSVVIKIGDAEATFDPSEVTPAELAAYAEALRPKGSGG